MEVFRIARADHALKMETSGFAGRWNKSGQKVLYAASSRSLATLEMIVHRNLIASRFPYKTMVISVADENRLIRQVMSSDLPENWRLMKAYSKLQEVGSDWYMRKEFLLLQVPSAVIPPEYNYIINTEHPEYVQCVKLVKTEDYFWDERL